MGNHVPSLRMPPELLRPEQMAEADRHALRAGTPGTVLMEAAGRAVAGAILARAPEGRVTVLAGPGNNGGDGLVAARILAREGRPVQVALLGAPDGLPPDAASALSRWNGPTVPMKPDVVKDTTVVVDAIFGAGLSRAVEGPARDTLEAAGQSGAMVVAVDVPSGVDGSTGEVRGFALPSDLSVTFFRCKPGHVLAPGRFLAGDIVLGDIGIPEQALDGLRIDTWRNMPALWRDAIAIPRWDAHKYRRGHVVVVGGPAHRSGASRLAAIAALRAGAGVVTLAVPRESLQACLGAPFALMVEDVDPSTAFAERLADSRITTVVLGPGNGVGETTRSRIRIASGAGKRLVLDADALTSLAGHRDHLVRCCAEAEAVVLTPHEGEFRTLFPDIEGPKIERARKAARRSGAVVVLKGPDTVVARPDGDVVVNANAPPDLATAGAGDVLAGMIGGFLASGTPAFKAACAAVWTHGSAAASFGRGLIADDLPGRIPVVLEEALKS